MYEDKRLAIYTFRVSLNIAGMIHTCQVCYFVSVVLENFSVIYEPV